MMDNNIEALSREDILLKWATTTLGGSICRVQPSAGGNRRRALLLDVELESGAVIEAFLRFTSSNAPESADPYTLRRESLIYRALQNTGVPIPRLFAIHPQMEAMLVERVSGSASFHQISTMEERKSASIEFIDAIARLHRLAVTSLELHPCEEGMTCERAIRAELVIWRKMYAETCRGDPLIAAAFAWLEANVPEVQEPAVLVHGDAGPGNFMVDHGKLTAIIDWELWHFGDPIEDLAWLSMRSTIEPMPDFQALMRRYEERSGVPIDVKRMLYHRAFVTLRVAIIRHRDFGSMAADSDAGASTISRVVNRRLLFLTIAKMAQLPIPVERRLEASPTDAEALFDFILLQLRTTIAPNCTDPLAVTKIKSVARVVKYLKERDRLREIAETLEMSILGNLLKTVPVNITGGRNALAAEIEAGRLSLAAVLGYLSSQMARDSQMAETALGALSGRDFPEFQVH